MCTWPCDECLRQRPGWVYNTTSGAVAHATTLEHGQMAKGFRYRLDRRPLQTCMQPERAHGGPVLCASGTSTLGGMYCVQPARGGHVLCATGTGTWGACTASNRYGHRGATGTERSDHSLQSSCTNGSCPETALIQNSTPRGAYMQYTHAAAPRLRERPG